jgi:hypothetical protein
MNRQSVEVTRRAVGGLGLVGRESFAFPPTAAAPTGGDSTFLIPGVEHSVLIQTFLKFAQPTSY